MGAGHGPEYEQVKQQMSGWPPPSPSPSGGGISCSLSRLRERVRVRVLLPPAHLCSVPSGLLSFPRWGKAGMGAGHGPEYEQVKQQMPGWPPPSPSGGGNRSEGRRAVQGGRHPTINRQLLRWPAGAPSTKWPVWVIFYGSGRFAEANPYASCEFPPEYVKYSAISPVQSGADHPGV